MDKIFAEVVPAQLQHLETLLGAKTTFASKVTAGDLAIATVLNIIIALQVGHAMALSATFLLQNSSKHSSPQV